MRFSNATATLLVNTATIKRFTLVDSNNGGSKKTFAAVSGMSNVPCSRQGISGNKQLFADKLQITVTHSFYFNSVLALQNGDQITDENGINYNVEHFEDQGGTGQVFYVMGNRILE